jgi:hypothetical protein
MDRIEESRPSESSQNVTTPIAPFFWRLTRARLSATSRLRIERSSIPLPAVNTDKFLSHDYLNVLSRQNASVLGSMTEQSCLSAIGSLGLNHAGLHFKPNNCQGYDNDPPPNLPHPGERCSTLFVLNNPRNPYIDALYPEL